MSSGKISEKRPKTDDNEPLDSPAQKLKTGKVPLNNEDTTQSKQLVRASNGKIFYPCKYCCKIFQQKLGSITHMEKCPNKLDKSQEMGTNNNDMEQKQLHTNNSNSGLEKTSPDLENKITQRITHDMSIYDYNEEDNLDEKDLESGDEALNNRECKHCHTLFDNPLDLLRHTRNCHNFPRTILPPNEIEKYFDYPNRQFCPICEKPIKTRNFRSVFIKHLLVHTTGLTHECSICKKKFRRRDHMRAHEKRHIVSL